MDKSKCSMDKIAIVVLENDDVCQVFLVPKDEAGPYSMNIFRDNMHATGLCKWQDPDTDREVVRRVQRVLVQEADTLHDVYIAIHQEHNG